MRSRTDGSIRVAALDLLGLVCLEGAANRGQRWVPMRVACAVLPVALVVSVGDTVAIGMVVRTPAVKGRLWVFVALGQRHDCVCMWMKR